jgi:hypothetical protein
MKKICSKESNTFCFILTRFVSWVRKVVIVRDMIEKLFLGEVGYKCVKEAERLVVSSVLHELMCRPSVSRSA